MVLQLAQVPPGIGCGKFRGSLEVSKRAALSLRGLSSSDGVAERTKEHPHLEIEGVSGPYSAQVPDAGKYDEVRCADLRVQFFPDRQR